MKVTVYPFYQAWSQWEGIIYETEQVKSASIVYLLLSLIICKGTSFILRLPSLWYSFISAWKCRQPRLMSSGLLLPMYTWAHMESLKGGKNIDIKVWITFSKTMLSWQARVRHDDQVSKGKRIQIPCVGETQRALLGSYVSPKSLYL